MSDLGSIRGQIEIEGSGAISTVEKVESSVRRLDGLGSDALSGLSSAGDRIKALEDRAESFRQKYEGLGKGLLAGSAGIAAGLGYAAKGAIDFESAMANVNSIAGYSAEELRNVETELQNLAAASGKGPVELAEGLYDVVSSGFEGADAMTVLTAATNAANAGLTDTATSGKAISAVLNGYKLSADQAENVSDVLFQTVNSGVITFEQLASNMGSVIPVASSLGVPITEVGAAYATLTQNGISAAESETALAAVMRSALNPTEQLTAAAQEQGYASVEAMVAAEGLTGLLGLLSEESGGSAEKMTELLGSSEATTAALALTGTNTEFYTETLEKMNLAMGDATTTADALAVQQASTGAALQRLSAAFQVARIQVGQLLLPLINLATNVLTAVLRGFLGLSDGMKTFLTYAASATAAVMALAGGALLLYPRLLSMGATVLNLAKDFPRLASGIRLVGTALRTLFLSPVALVALGAFLAYQSNFLGFGDAVRGLAKAFGSLEIVQKVRGWIADAAEVVSGFIGAFSGFFGAFQDQAAESTEAATRSFDGLNETVQNADGTTSYFYTELQDDGTYKRVGEIVDSVANADGKTAEVLIKTEDGEYWATVDLMTGEIVGESTIEVTAETEDARGKMERLNDGVKAFTTSLRQINGDNTPAWIVNLASAIDGAMVKVNQFVAAFQGLRSAGLNPVSAALSALAGIFPGLSGPLEALSTKFQIFSDLMAGFRAAGLNPVMAALEALTSMFPALSGVVDPLVSAFGNLREAFSAVGELFSALFSGDWSKAAGALNDVFENMGEALEDVGSAVENFGDLAKKAMNGLAKRFPALSRTFTAFGRLAETVGDMIGDALGIVGDILQGNWAQAFQGAGNLLRGFMMRFLDLGSLITAVIADAAGLLRAGLGAAFDWLAGKAGDFGESVRKIGGIFDGLLGVVEGVASAFSALLSGDWGGFFSGLGDAAASAFDVLKNGFTLVPQLLIDAFQAIDWGALGSLLQRGATAALQGLQALSSMAFQWLQDAASSIDFGAIGSAILNGITGALSGLGSAISSAAGDIWGWIKDKASALDLSGAWESIKTKGTELLGKLKEGAEAGWETFTGWVSGLGSDIASWFSFLSPATLSLLATTAFNGIKTGAELAWNNFTGWVGGLADTILGFFDWLVPDELSTKAGEMFDGLKEGASTAWDTFTSWVGGLKDEILGKFSWLAASQLSVRAQTFINGIKTGATLAWTAVTTWVGGLKDIILGYFDWLSVDTLSTAAGDLIDGIKSGFDTAWTELTTWVTEKIDALKEKLNPSNWGIELNPMDWFGGDDGGGEDTPDAPSVDAPEGTTIPAPQATSFDGGAWAKAVNDALVAGISGLSGDSLAGAIENWVWRAVGGLSGRLADDGLELGRQMDAAAQTGFAGLSGASLGVALKGWIDRAITTTTATLPASGLALARAFDTAANTGFAGLSGASLAAAMGGWFGRAMTTVGSLLLPIGTAFGVMTDAAFNTGLSALSGASLGSGISGWVSRGMTTVASALLAIGTAFGVLLNTAFVSGIGQLSGASLGAAINTWVGEAMTTVAEGIETNLAAATASFDAFNTSTSETMGTWSATIPVMAALGGNAVRVESSRGTSAGKQSFITFSADTISVMGGWATGMETIVSGAADSIKTELQDASTNGSTSLRTLATNASTSASNIATAGQRGGADFRSGISNGFRDAVSAARTAAGDIAGALGGLAGRLRSIGENASMAFAEGLRAGIGAARAAANELAAIAASAAESKLAISSPSRVFIEIGRMVVAGLISGLERMQRPLLEAARAMAGTVPEEAGAPAMALAGFTPTTGYRAEPPAARASSGGAGAGPVNVSYTILTIPPDDWIRVARQAETAPERSVALMIQGYDSIPKER